jgi:hypothetical protein
MAVGKGVVEGNIKVNSKATDRSVRSTGASLRSADSRGGCLYMSCGAACDSRFLHYAVASAPAPVGMTRPKTEPRANQRQRQRQRTGVSVPHGHRFDPLDRRGVPRVLGRDLKHRSLLIKDSASISHAVEVA